MRLIWFFGALVLTGALAIFNSIALEQYLYWKFEWFDTFMHFLGGMSIAAFVGAILLTHRPYAFFGISFVAFVAWEVFEYLFGIPREANYAFDTTIDFIMDILGALVVYVLMKQTLWRSA